METIVYYRACLNETLHGSCSKCGWYWEVKPDTSKPETLKFAGQFHGPFPMQWQAIQDAAITHPVVIDADVYDEDNAGDGPNVARA